MTTYGLPTVGVEEEFLLVDSHTLRPTAANQAVIAHAQAMGIDAVSELTELQIETNSPPLQQLRELREHVISTRTMLSAVALSHDVRLLAVGVSPVARVEPGPVPITDSARYRRLAEAYGALADSVATCGGHVHVEVPNKAIAVEVCNFLRPWLPTLLAMTSNSAIHDGADTRHASWRSTVWGRWPSAGPPPYLDSVDHYDDLVASMTRSGVVLDEASLYWDVRPSIHQPTVEVRVGDVPAVADEVALSAALVRGLVMTAVSAIERGERAPVLDGHHLAAAYHRARVHGLTGDGVDPFTGKLAPAWSLLRSLVRCIRPALTAAGDTRYVETSLERLRHLGNGAERQREVFSRTGDPVAVASLAARCTTSDWSASMAHTAT
ncbi:glutamate--cysteine ligase [Rhodococcus fascians]|nr:glutamate--cysteine ligase [Rhodococcus fascians]MBY4020791.1 glutamate--cysteine ligase [Rhodococcus fascians]MBY4035772.1 glutamate--cysteine ligase [Rhodococcus fascians]MBY4138426.1 glutamate--cysteine ligase [Rhodococcus fascians]MBY4218070.1 glutamate--cysteine ligase [Rhodococcus fascians]